MAIKPYDFIVIGGGSAGFNAARVAADLGQRVAVVDGARKLGGLCILRGCMPSKTLLYSAEVLQLAKHGADFGLKIGPSRADMPAMHRRKLRIIADFAGHRTEQLLNGKFALYRSRASFVDPHTLALQDGRRLKARHFLIATGSRVSQPPVPGLQGLGCWTSDEVLELDFVPRSVLVLGGGVVACELAQFLHRVGAKVTLIQRSPQLLREHSVEAAGAVERALRDEGVEIFTQAAIQSLARRGPGFEARFKHRGRTLVRRADHCLNALGREPALEGLNLAAAGIKLGPKGHVRINRWQQSSAPHIYAAGDCSGPVEIVHIAVQQGELAARHAARVPGIKPVDYRLSLSVVFTEPQLASLGRVEKDLKASGTPFLTAAYPFDDHGKSILMECQYGHVRIFAEPKRGRLLGAEIVGPWAGELIHCLSGPLAMRATVFDLLKAPWYHPTLAEIITYPLEEIAERVKR